MSSRPRGLGSSIGAKLLIGATGLGLVLYLLTHIAGNVLILLGPAIYNEYAHTLTSNPILPVIEIGLALVFVVHIYKAIRNYAANRQARPTPYAVKRPAGTPSRKSLASSTMILSGVWLLVFLILHVKAFRFGLDYRTPDGLRDLYRVEMEIFASHLTVAFYVISMVLVGSHLWHGFSSAFQSLGVDDARWTPRLVGAGKVLAVVISGGFIMITLWAHLTGGRP